MGLAPAQTDNLYKQNYGQTLKNPSRNLHIIIANLGLCPLLRQK